MELSICDQKSDKEELWLISRMLVLVEGRGGCLCAHAAHEPGSWTSSPLLAFIEQTDLVWCQVTAAWLPRRLSSKESSCQCRRHRRCKTGFKLRVLRLLRRGRESRTGLVHTARLPCLPAWLPQHRKGPPVYKVDTAGSASTCRSQMSCLWSPAEHRGGTVHP